TGTLRAGQARTAVLAALLSASGREERVEVLRRVVGGAEAVAEGAGGRGGVGGGRGGGRGGPAAGAAGPVGLNTATAEQLDQLPGVGPVLAQHIIDYRTEHGGFRSVEELREVNGIGDRRFADLQDLVRP
ncbi:ComEA family DNA-binding protein, partial [Streptomyces sp. G44]|uniref:ComEA family DNA-binding protein n=1 Tax=Streptomyces sp. G44 TaxID=2807632 RepID=UPI001EF90D0A